MNAPFVSCIYEGWVRHRRHAPHAHAFRYKMYMLYLDLAELDRVRRNSTTDGGRFVLLRGEAGVGKTTAPRPL